MEADTTKRVDAEVSVRDDGQIYVGVKTRQMLEVGYNDKVKITFEEKGPSGSDITVSGYLNSSSRIQAGCELCRTVASDKDVESIKSTYHVNAIVKAHKMTWSDENNEDSTARRWDKVKHLAASLRV